MNLQVHGPWIQGFWNMGNLCHLLIILDLLMFCIIHKLMSVKIFSPVFFSGKIKEICFALYNFFQLTWSEAVTLETQWVVSFELIMKINVIFKIPCPIPGYPTHMSQQESLCMNLQVHGPWGQAFKIWEMCVTYW